MMHHNIFSTPPASTIILRRFTISLIFLSLSSSSIVIMSSSSFSTTPTVSAATTAAAAANRFDLIDFSRHHHHHPRSIMSVFSTKRIIHRPRFASTTTTTSTTTMMMMMMRGGDSTNRDMNDPAAIDNSILQKCDSKNTSMIIETPSSSSSSSLVVPTTLSSSNKQPPSLLGPKAPPPGYFRSLFPSFPWHELPNYLTYARCLSIPLFLIHAYLPAHCPFRAPHLGCLFALASITDWFDGYLARRWDVTSPFGAFLDPVADKLMVCTALIVLSGRYGGIVAIPSAIILAREVGVSALREWMASRGRRESVKVGMQGKVKAAITMISITCLLFVPEGVGLESVVLLPPWMRRYFGNTSVLGGAACGMGNVVGKVVVGEERVVKNVGLPWLLGPSLLMLFASAIITVTSGSVYFRAALPVLLGKE